MRLIVRAVWVFALWVFAIGGCSEVAAVDTVQVRIVVAGEEGPLEGALVCQTGTTNCVTTDAIGDATLGQLPANEKLSYTVEKQGYGSLLYPIVTGSSGTSASLDSNMITDEVLTQQLANLDSFYPLRDTGGIRVIITPRFAGATFRLLNATGKAWYSDEEGNMSSELEATTSGEGCCGSGGFIEVGPGVFQIEIGGTAESCTLSTSFGTARGWPGDEVNRIEVPVREGFFTRAVLVCAKAP
jgi:hypothetical protein